MAKLYDCFMLYNEIDLLRLRLIEGSPYVEKFIITEARMSHRGERKPLWSENCKELFDEYKDKIVHIIVDFPETYEEFSNELRKHIYKNHNMAMGKLREGQQRNEAYQYLSTCDGNDICMVSDLDEIPHYSLIKEDMVANKSNILTDKVNYSMPTYVYNIHYRQMNYNPTCAFTSPIKFITADNLTTKRFYEGARVLIHNRITHLNRFMKPHGLLIKEAGMFEGGGSIITHDEFLPKRKEYLLRNLRGEWGGLVYGDYPMPANIGVLSKFFLLTKDEMNTYVQRIQNSTDEEFNCIYNEILGL